MRKPKKILPKVYAPNKIDYEITIDGGVRLVGIPSMARTASLSTAPQRSGRLKDGLPTVSEHWRRPRIEYCSINQIDIIDP
jgi:hypothetical protein